MRNYNFIKIIFLSTFIFLSCFSFSYAKSNGIDVNLRVGSCNNDGICDSWNEDFFSCPLDCTPPPPPPSTGGSSGYVGSIFNNLIVEVSYNSAIIKWKSSIPTMSSIKWGTSPDYRDGALRNVDYLLDHRVEINNLKDGTIYYFSIEAENLLGGTNSLENQFFTTLSLPDTTPPSNPTNVIAELNNSGITISWENPKEEDFDYIRVMKNDDRFYGNPFIGRLVYEGNGKYFTDSNVSLDHKYFYSLFSRDRAGNYSSGSLIDVIYRLSGFDLWGTNIPQIQKVDKLTNVYKVIQGSTNYDFNLGNIISLKSDEPIIVKTDSILKTSNDDMWIEIIDRDSHASKYFFSHQIDKDSFVSADIPSFLIGGYYSVNIYKYTTKNDVPKIVNQGAFLITKLPGEVSNNYIWYYVWITIFIIFILLILWLFLLFYRRRKDKKEEERQLKSNP
jgi:hypothetical protein